MNHPFSYYQNEAFRPFAHCQESVDYVAEQKSLKAAWFNCKSSSWLWWIVDDLTNKGYLPEHHRITMTDIRDEHGYTDSPAVCDLIREAVPYLTVRRAFGKFARDYDKANPNV